uniref:Uncharacterized protein n=1 Tax=Timema douglasi TaxID=61478 RepID=A0A7R8Z4D5_TIMDO|nr:unnamed protein product [Timema douglasi]
MLSLQYNLPSDVGRNEPMPRVIEDAMLMFDKQTNRHRDLCDDTKRTDAMAMRYEKRVACRRVAYWKYHVAS